MLYFGSQYCNIQGTLYPSNAGHRSKCVFQLLCGMQSNKIINVVAAVFVCGAAIVFVCGVAVFVCGVTVVFVCGVAVVFLCGVAVVFVCGVAVVYVCGVAVVFVCGVAVVFECGVAVVFVCGVAVVFVCGVAVVVAIVSHKSRSSFQMCFLVNVRQTQGNKIINAVVVGDDVAFIGVVAVVSHKCMFPSVLFKLMSDKCRARK